MTFDLSPSESAGSRSLHRLVRHPFPTPDRTYASCDGSRRCAGPGAGFPGRQRAMPQARRSMRKRALSIEERFTWYTSGTRQVAPSND